MDEALTRFAATQPQAAQLVQLRYFAGLTIPDAACTLGVSARTADRLWAYARAWLHQEIVGEPLQDDSEKNLTDRGVIGPALPRLLCALACFGSRAMVYR
jgi:hypothetical protein